MLAPVLSVPNDISTAVASKSADILIKVSHYPNGLQTLTSPEGPLSGLKSTNDIGAEKRIRLLNLAAGISSESPKGREAIASGGFLGSLSKFNDFRTDLLEALNLIVIFNQLLDTSHGVEFLQTSGLLGELAIKEGDVDELLLADLIRLYGKLLSRDPPKNKSWNDYPFLSLLTSNLESDRPTLQEAATSVSHLTFIFPSPFFDIVRFANCSLLLTLASSSQTFVLTNFPLTPKLLGCWSGRCYTRWIETS
jgi:hypothetical protein